MSRPPVLILRAAGINCDEETAYAWSLAGAAPTLMHINELAARPAALGDYPLLTLPGGFSYGDDVGAGVILAQRVEHELSDAIAALLERGGGILGICNGFQVLVKAGLLPGGPVGRDAVTVTHNDKARYEARWVRLKVAARHCPFLTAGAVLELPIAHAEGRIVTSGPQVASHLRERGLVAVHYCEDDAEGGCAVTYPANPNASEDGMAGLCDETGRIFGLMPHPDRYFDHHQHPDWPARDPARTPDGLTIFQNAVRRWG